MGGSAERVAKGSASQKSTVRLGLLVALTHAFAGLGLRSAPSSRIADPSAAPTSATLPFTLYRSVGPPPARITPVSAAPPSASMPTPLAPKTVAMAKIMTAPSGTLPYKHPCIIFNSYFFLPAKHPSVDRLRRSGTDIGNNSPAPISPNIARLQLPQVRKIERLYFLLESDASQYFLYIVRLLLTPFSFLSVCGAAVCYAR